jgi:hypothetical protein
MYMPVSTLSTTPDGSAAGKEMGELGNTETLLQEPNLELLTYPV